MRTSHSATMATPLQEVQYESHSFDLDALRCPRCGSTLRLLAAIEDPAIARRILECIGLPARAPPTSAPPPSGGPFEPAPSPIEDADFDQTPPYEEP